MANSNAGSKAGRWSARLLTDPIWLLIGAVSGFIAGRVFGRLGLKVYVFQHMPAAVTLSICLIAGFFVARKFSNFSGWCLWSATFCIGLISFRYW